MMFMQRFAALLLAAAVALLPAVEMPQSTRERNLRARFLAPCCWSESLAQHQSPMATELRDEIHAAILAGKSDSDIEAELTRRYGRRILVDPGGLQGRVPFLVPLLALAGGAIWVMILLRRWTPRNGDALRSGAA